MSSICIIGSRGFIGSHVAKRFPSATLLERKDLDLLDEEAVKNYFMTHRFDLVIHCAAVGGSRLKTETDDIFNQNVNMFTSVYKTINSAHLIWFSSGAASGDTPYGRAKKYIENLVSADPRVHVIKIWGCFGPNEPAQRLLATGIRDGHVKISKDRLFDFVHVQDVVNTVQCIIDSRFRLEPRCIHMVYPEPHVLLSEVLKIANISYTLESDEKESPYIGKANFLLRPVLKERILQYINEGC
jgi:nucleoside-diphosphate-sugar epimerase